MSNPRMASSGESKTGPTDGRRLRSERTRQLIIEAYLALLRDNPRIPTSAQVAARAGYSVRSVFERFPDMLALRIAATDQAYAEGSDQAIARDVDGDRPTRIRSQVETRGRTCEKWLPLWRAVNANSGETADLQLRIRLMRDAIRQRIELMYRRELESLTDPARQQTIIAIEMVTDFESWGRMRELYGLSFDDACAVWVRAIDRLLPAPPAEA